MKLSLLLAFIGVVAFTYGWVTHPPALSLIELLNMEPRLQDAYFNEVNRATFMRMTGCALTAIGLVAFVIIRSIKIHKTIKLKL